MSTEFPLPAAEPPHGARILIVDDNVDAASGMSRLLQFAGYDVRVAHDGRTALAIAEDHQPEFVLLDIGLPDMDGYEVARHLRGDSRHCNAVIIAISGYGEEDHRDRSRAAGFDHHLVKPIDLDTLRTILGHESVVRGGSGRGAPGVPEATAGTGPIPGPLDQ
jgi:CheY-like chemotaxis protein